MERKDEGSEKDGDVICCRSSSVLFLVVFFRRVLFRSQNLSGSWLAFLGLALVLVPQALVPELAGSRPAFVAWIGSGHRRSGPRLHGWLLFLSCREPSFLGLALVLVH